MNLIRLRYILLIPLLEKEEMYRCYFQSLPLPRKLGGERREAHSFIALSQRNTPWLSGMLTQYIYNGTSE